MIGALFRWPWDLSLQVNPVGLYTPIVAILSIVPHLFSSTFSPQTYALHFDLHSFSSLSHMLNFPFVAPTSSLCFRQTRPPWSHFYSSLNATKSPIYTDSSSFPLSHYVANLEMPFKWDAESERALLLLVITEMSPPAGAIWANVAERLGRGLNGNACRYYALIELFFFISELLTCS